MFSSRWATWLVPGIGSMTGERWSSHARATAPGVTPWCSAAVASGPPGFARSPEANGNHGMNPISWASQWSSTSSLWRLARL